MTVKPKLDAALLAAGFQRLCNDVWFGFSAPGTTAHIAVYRRKGSGPEPEIEGVKYRSGGDGVRLAEYRINKLIKES